jgi:hypothetical protein
MTNHPIADHLEPITIVHIRRRGRRPFARSENSVLTSDHDRVDHCWIGNTERSPGFLSLYDGGAMRVFREIGHIAKDAEGFAWVHGHHPADSDAVRACQAACALRGDHGLWAIMR